MEFVRVSNPYLSSSESVEVAQEKQHRAQLMAAIRNICFERGLNQTAAAKHLGIPQPRISDIMNGKVSACTVEKLFSYLRKFGVEINFQYNDGTFNANVKQKDAA